VRPQTSRASRWLASALQAHGSSRGAQETKPQLPASGRVRAPKELTAWEIRRAYRVSIRPHSTIPRKDWDRRSGQLPKTIGALRYAAGTSMTAVVCACSDRMWTRETTRTDPKRALQIEPGCERKTCRLDSSPRRIDIGFDFLLIELASPTSQISMVCSVARAIL